MKSHREGVLYMKSNKTTNYGWGYILADCILLIDAIIDVCEGETTTYELLILCVLCVVTACSLLWWIKKRRNRKNT